MANNLLNPQEIANERLRLDAERLELDHKRYLLDNRFLNRNFAAIVGSIVSLAAVLVSITQVWIASISKDKELKLSENQANLQYDLSQKQSDREYNLAWAKFVSENEKYIFSKNSKERDFFRSLLLASFPPKQIYELTDKMQLAIGSDTSSNAQSVTMVLSDIKRSLPLFECSNDGFNYISLTSGTFVIHLETLTLGKMTEAAIYINGHTPPTKSRRHIENWNGDWTVELYKGFHIGVFTKTEQNDVGSATTGRAGGSTSALNFSDGAFFVSFSVQKRE